MINLCEPGVCTGCGSCAASCPKNAIKMMADDCGFLYPSIDRSKCVSCHNCQKVCPSLIVLRRDQPKKVYAALSKDASPNSTSGGLAYTFYRRSFAQGWKCYGVLFNSVTHSFQFIEAKELRDIEGFCGSKYCQAFAGNLFKTIEENLKENKNVLFIGTPCQVAGLKAFLKIDYENLVSIDLICHGCPSEKMLFQELSFFGIERKNVSKINFREGGKYVLSIYNEKDEKVLRKSLLDSYYLESFMGGSSLRMSCEECQYANPKRVGDLTIGDFWGLGKDSKISSKGRRVSLLLANNEKGLNFLARNSDNTLLEERNLAEAVQGNSQLGRPIGKLDEMRRFRKYYLKNNNDFVKAVKESRPLKRKIKHIPLVLLAYKKINKVN